MTVGVLGTMLLAGSSNGPAHRCCTSPKPLAAPRAHRLTGRGADRRMLAGSAVSAVTTMAHAGLLVGPAAVGLAAGAASLSAAPAGGASSRRCSRWPLAARLALDARPAARKARQMPVPTPERYAAMLEAALDGGYAYAAVNVTSSQTLNGALRGFAEAEADGIVQITVGGARYLAGGGDAATGARALAGLARELAPRLPVEVALHTDHCPPEHVDAFLRPLLDASRKRVDRGKPALFNSHMFDGSTLPLEENLETARELLDECAELGIVLEVECGVVGGEENGVGGDVDAERLYTTTDDLLRVADVLGTGDRGRYLLAATFGNVHGVYAPGHVTLRPEILREGQEALGGRPRFAYVFHGSSGTAPAQLAEAISYGVVKVNVDTDLQYAFTRAVADHVLTRYDGVLRIDGGIGDKRAYDPRAWGSKGEESMAARVVEACRALGSAGRSLGR